MREMPFLEMKKCFNIENRRYLGSKARLIDFIHKVVQDNCKNVRSFMDLFAGTGNVGWSFNSKGTSIIVNDLLHSNYVSYLAWFGSQKIRKDYLDDLIQSYNQKASFCENYFSKNFSNTYFSELNCKKIGYIRDDIEKQYKRAQLNEREKAYLVTSLLYAMDHIANTVGHYDAYRMNGNLNKELLLEPLNVPADGINDNNLIFEEDANELVKKVSADLVYIDTPYNSRQYCDAYHLLENVADWTRPKVYGVAKKMKRDLSLKSAYCSQKAPIFFEDLISHIKAKYILVSYNNMGHKGAGRSQAKMSDDDIINALKKKGKVKIFSTSFNQFTTGKTNIEDHQERLFLCLCGTEDNSNQTTSLVDDTGFSKSPLNYTGGKYRLLSQLISHFDSKETTFVDLFGGGFNVGVNVPQNNVVYLDKQKEVTRLIKLIYVTPFDVLINQIESVVSKFNLSDTTKYGYDYYGCKSDSGVGKFNKIGYELLRDEYNSISTSAHKDLLLLTLIFYSFNNQIRFNASGKFNMPVGKRDFNGCARNNLKRFSSKIKKKDISFYSFDFEKLENKLNTNCFVYCDPPYFLGTASYNENDGWTEKDESRLLDFLVRLDKKGIKFALSNLIEHHGKKHNMLINWIAENHFNTIYIKSKYTNSNYHLKNKTQPSIEVLITNY